MLNACNNLDASEMSGNLPLQNEKKKQIQWNCHKNYEKQAKDPLNDVLFEDHEVIKVFISLNMCLLFCFNRNVPHLYLQCLHRNLEMNIKFAKQIFTTVLIHYYWY